MATIQRVRAAAAGLAASALGTPTYSNDVMDDGWEREAVILAGWLTKQGGKHKNWKKRWFVIRGYQMLYFKDQMDDLGKELGVISLAYPMDKDGSLTREVEKLPDEPKRKFMFTIKGKHPDQRSYNLMADSADSMQEWIDACKRVIYSPLGGGMFGCVLWDQVVKEGRGPDKIPIIAEKCIAYLLNKGLEEPGVFRLPGRVARIEELREAFTRGENPDISDEPEVHAVGSLLKRYIRDLPAPLLSAERFPAFISVAEVYEQNEEEGMLVLQQLVRDLPVCNAYLLKAMCEFLSKVSEHSAVNKMDAHNLAVVFAPGFLAAPADASPEELIKSQSTTQTITRILIENPKSAFCLMPEPDPSIWRLFQDSVETSKEKSRNTSASEEFERDGDDGGEDDDDGAGSPIKPALPSQAVLAQTQAVIDSLPPIEKPATRRRMSLGSLKRQKNMSPAYENPLEKAASPDVVELELQVQSLKSALVGEQERVKELEAQIAVLQEENADLKEDLAMEKAARLAMGGALTADPSPPPSSNPFRNLSM